MDSTIEQIGRALNAFLRPEQDPRQARKRERILAAATAQFIQYGYRKTSVDAVARDAGVAKGTVYLYYRNKAELLFHAITREKEQYLVRLGPLDDLDMEPSARLHRFIVVGLMMSRTMPLVTRMIGGDHEFRLAMEEVDGELLERVNRLQIAITRNLLQEAGGHAWPEVELDRRAKVLIDLMYAVMTSGPMVRQGLMPEEYARTMADLVIGGILAPSGERRATGETARPRRSSRQGQSETQE
jgi:AcrR family transcriptional regulator